MSEQSTEQNMDNLNKAIAGTNDTATEKEFLDNIRQNIDAVDCEIQTLINNRAKLAQQVAAVKKATQPIVHLMTIVTLFFIVQSERLKY
ncbi:hypothetical protein Psyaliredsea_14130 [Psychrobacter alimentarius]